MVNDLSVFLHVSTQDLFDRAEEPFESVPIDPDQSAGSGTFDACLSDRVFDQGDLAEILSLFILEDLFNRLCAFFLLGDEFSFGDNIEPITVLPLLHDVLAGPIAL